jgi:hypothetical protein
MYTYCDSTKGKYAGIEAASMDAFRALRKPIKYTTLLGVQVPKAYVRNMQAIVNLCADLGINETELTLEHFPDFIREHIEWALSALMKDTTHVVEELSVYEYLGIIDIMYRSDKFIHGGKLIDSTPLNWIKTGNTSETITKLCKIKRTEPSDYDDSLITENIIEITSQYRKLERKYGYELEKLDAACMKLFLKRNGY